MIPLLSRLLELPSIYTFTQKLWYRAGQQEKYVTSWIRPQKGNRVLDIGCGPGTLCQWMGDIHYVGYDPNPQYIRQAQHHFGQHGQFVCGLLTTITPEEVGTYDIVLANGVLHHLSDAQVESLMNLSYTALKPGGRLITRDGCFESHQNRLAYFLLQSDRGDFVRAADAYAALFRKRFHVQRMEIIRDALRLPYSLIQFEGLKR